MNIRKRKYLLKLWFIVILFSFSWCIEPYDFKIINNEPTLVVESYISNKSYLESLDFPSDGRYFEIKLKRTSDVSNIHDQAESNAKVTLLNNLNEEWEYSEAPHGSGRYFLFNNEFKAQKSVQYKLQINLANGESYESSWEMLPETHVQEMGDISFKEVVEQGYVREAGEEIIRDIDGVEIYVNLPENNMDTPLFYRWNFTPIWIYTTTFPPRNPADKNPKCWITNNYYLTNFILQKDNAGGYPQKLTFLKTTGNHRVYKKFSLLITQRIMSEEYFNFWNEMQEQSEKGGLFDTPPSNLKTNFKALNTNNKVSGYFGVVEENATRWYFDINDLSYQVEDDVIELCNISYGPDGPGGPECYNCIEYPYGDPSSSKPSWWLD
jgi:hypothetical protein